MINLMTSYLEQLNTNILEQLDSAPLDTKNSQTMPEKSLDPLFISNLFLSFFSGTKLQLTSSTNNRTCFKVTNNDSLFSEIFFNRFRGNFFSLGLKLKPKYTNSFIHEDFEHLGFDIYHDTLMIPNEKVIELAMLITVITENSLVRQSKEKKILFDYVKTAYSLI